MRQKAGHLSRSVARLLFITLAFCGVEMNTARSYAPTNEKLGAQQPRERPPYFWEYPVNSIYKNKVGTVKISGRDQYLYRTRIKSLKGRTPDFAGHYVIDLWGCGTECLMGVIVDARTGRAHFLPFTICCWEHYEDRNFRPVRYQLKSRMIIFEGSRNEQGKGVYYYEWKNNQLKLIHSIEKQ